LRRNASYFLCGHASAALQAARSAAGLSKYEGNKSLKAATLIGLLLILLGIVGFVYGGIHYTQRHRDADLGPVHISHRQHKTVPLPPVLSGIAFVGGIILVVAGARSS
jgi:uncharacterized membrane protein YidH (DUF202 family)